MSVKNGSAEIFELDDARARLRASEIDPKNFLAVGPYLEAVRTQQGLSIATLSDRIHVKAAYLEAIEQMTIDALPSKPYAIGFLRVYAEALGLDPAPVVERFKDEAGYSAARKEPEPTKAAPAPAERPEPMRLSLLAVLAILGFMIWCAYLVTHPSPDAIKKPLKLSGVPLAVEAIDARPAADAPAAAAPAVETQSFEPGAVPPLPVIIEAQLVERIEPVYPPGCETAAAAVETVDLAFTITPDGAVVSERVTSSSNSCFDRAALNAVKRWRFSPRTIDGEPRPAFEQQANFRFERPS
ncbi:MAG: TonB family protein [Pseudomonadota bacterium]